MPPIYPDGLHGCQTGAERLSERHRAGGTPSGVPTRQGV